MHFAKHQNISARKVAAEKLSNQNNKLLEVTIPANIYLLKVINRNYRKICEMCSKLTIKTLERGQLSRPGVFC